MESEPASRVYLYVFLCVCVDDDENDCDKEKYKTCLGCTVSELSCEWCSGDCQYIGTCNSAQVCSTSHFTYYTV